MEIINLDMTPSTVTPNAHAGQYDSSRTIRFMLKNGGVPFTLAGTETITAEITRSDNTEVTVNVANTSSNYVDVVFDDTVCTVKGLYACELRLKDSDGFDIGSKNFALLVQRDPYDGAGVVVETVGPADICTFETTLPEPLQSVLVDVVASQPSGTPTPSTPLPITGYTEANITANGNTHTISFGQTVYGGQLDVTRGKLHVTWGSVDLGSLTWDKDTVGTNWSFYVSSITGAKAPPDIYTAVNAICSNYPIVMASGNTSYTNNEIAFMKSNGQFFIVDSTYTTESDFKTAMDGVILAYELATPFDIDLTPEVILAIVGVNNVFADCGQATVKYLTAE